MAQETHWSRRKQERSPNGFTLIELLTVIVAVGMLMALLLPALAGTRQQDKSAVCLNNLRQIGVGMLMFAAENDDAFYNFNGSLPNGGQWFSNPLSTNMLAPGNSSAYWGVAYFGYVGRTREVFRCPEARMVDEWRDSGLSYPSEFWLTSTYGIAGYLTSPGKTRGFTRPSTTIFVQDAAESKMEGNSDTIGLFPGSTQILSQWVQPGGLSALYGNYPFQWEWYRHDKRCHTLWLSGNASRISFNGLNVGIDYRYYTGERPALPLP